MKELSPRQRDVLAFIEATQEKQGVTPTIREIATHFGFSSPNAAMVHVRAMERKGYLKSMAGRARTLQVTTPFAPRLRSRPKVVPVPIFGAIPAGQPIDAEQENEGCVLIDVETLGVRPSARTFGLKVRGDSMQGKHIVDGDIAVVEHGVQPRSGDVVAALIDGQVTLKTFVLQRGKPYLRAENPRYPDLIPQQELTIQGVMVALIRRRN